MQVRPVTPADRPWITDAVATALGSVRMELPAIGNHGIALRHELEFEAPLQPFEQVRRRA
jgi:hypothetical protein